MIRKAQSMDCVRIPSVEIKGEWVYNSTTRKRKEKKASRFSRTTYEGPSLALPTAAEKSSFMKSSGCDLTSFTSLDSHHSNKAPDALPQSPSTSASTRSSPRIDVNDRDQGMFVLNGERNVHFGGILIILLFFASMSSYNSDSQSKNFFFKSSHINPAERIKSKNSSNRLGSAMIESVTDILSPILPFTGGMDLRRDGNWKSWRNWFGLLINSNTHLDSQNTQSTMVSQNIIFSQEEVDSKTITERHRCQPVNCSFRFIKFLK